jgi:hypothetical protein
MEYILFFMNLGSLVYALIKGIITLVVFIKKKCRNKHNKRRRRTDERPAMWGKPPPFVCFWGRNFFPARFFRLTILR